MRIRDIAAGVAPLVLLAACSKASGGDSSAKPASSDAATASAHSSARPSTSSASASSSAAAPATAGMPGDWVPIDLAPGGAPWKGYSIAAPPGSTIKKAFEGPEITKDKVYSVVVSFTDTHLDNTKSDLREGVSYGTKPTFLTDGKDLLEYYNESTEPKQQGPKHYGFHMLVKVGSATIGCKSTVEIPTREGLAPFEAACKSLTKK